MARKGENIYKRKDGRYEGRYIKGRKINGKPHFGYVYGYAYAEVKHTLTLLKATSYKEASLHTIGKGSLAEYLWYWLENVKMGHIKRSTYAQYHERICKHIIPELGSVLVRRLSKEQVQGFVDKLGDSGLSPSTVRNIAGLLCSAMKKSVQLRLTALNPCDAISLPKAETKEGRALDRTEQVKLEMSLSDVSNETELGVLLALYAGLRIGEICALHWRDIDVAAGTLTVRGTLQRTKNFDKSGSKTMLLEGLPKSRRSMRKIPLPLGLIDKLRRYRSGISEDCYVLTGSKTPIEPRTFRARFNRLAADAGLNIPFHSLRHTFATRCLEHNFDMQTVSELLGHATAGVTMKIYAHSVFEHKRQPINKLLILSERHKPSNEPSDEVTFC